jgi:hypothetical protein
MKHIHIVTVKLPPKNVFPDLVDWLEQQGIEYGRDWVWYSADEFRFANDEHATVFALRWA